MVQKNKIKNRGAVSFGKLDKKLKIIYEHIDSPDSEKRVGEAYKILFDHVWELREQKKSNKNKL